VTARPPLVLVAQHFGATVFDRRTSRYAPFDREGAELLRATLARPFHAVAHDLADPDERDAVMDFFLHLEAVGYFDLDGRLAGVELPVGDVPPDHLVGPLAVHQEVVAACNLACTHCFAGELPRREKPLALSELDALFADLASMGSFRLGITGGEPLLRKDLFEVLDAATARGLHPCVTTNALLVDERVAREFGRRDLVWLNVSLDGATAASNDRVRGDGVFDRVRERLAVLGRHARFTLAFTVMRHNVDEVEACARLAAEVGAHTAVFRPLYPVGVAREHPELMPRFDDYAGALARLAAMDARALGEHDLRALDPFSPAGRDEGRAGAADDHACGAGATVCSVSVSGDVNPCSFLGGDFVAGNVRERPFAALWRESETMRRMRAPSAGQHGCRARSLAFAGDVDAPDPWVAEGSQLPEPVHPLVVLRTAKTRPAG
jgi:radical SAM protein with 4Fe4S-binding SPASM domain